MNLKSISILCTALLGLAVLTPQAQARDHRRDDDRRDRYEDRGRCDSDRDRHYSYDRDYDRRYRNYERCDDDRRDDRHHDHFSRGERVFSLIFGR